MRAEPREVSVADGRAAGGGFHRVRGDAPSLHADFDADLAATSAYVAALEDQAAVLPAPAERTPEQRATMSRIRRHGRQVRREFLRLHVDRVHAGLTDGRGHVRLEHLVYDAAEAHPWLVPAQKEIAEERRLKQADKEGREIDQAVFVEAVLNSPGAGRQLIDAMLQPTAPALERLPEFRRDGALDLGVVAIERRDGIAYVEVRNDRFLNAEDDAVIAALETAVDLALLDEGCEVGVLRGGPVTHPLHRGRRVFSAGINLTDLYYGRISYIDFLLRRELGLLHKMLRGHGLGNEAPGDPDGAREIPWIGAVDSFAIGGGLQMLLVMDRVVAESGAYVSLPALREGIVPGSGVLRLPRFVGDRIARQLVFGGRRIGVDEPEGRLVCDRVVPAVDMDKEIAAQAEQLTGPGVVGNRRMMHLVQEPLETFREYCALYAGQQAKLLYGAELIRNLEQSWLSRPRRNPS